MFAILFGCEGNVQVCNDDGMNLSSLWPLPLAIAIVVLVVLLVRPRRTGSDSGEEDR